MFGSLPKESLQVRTQLIMYSWVFWDCILGALKGLVQVGVAGAERRDCIVPPEVEEVP